MGIKGRGCKNLRREPYLCRGRAGFGGRKWSKGKGENKASRAQPLGTEAILLTRQWSSAKGVRQGVDRTRMVRVCKLPGCDGREWDTVSGAALTSRGWRMEGGVARRPKEVHLCLSGRLSKERQRW